VAPVSACEFLGFTIQHRKIKISRTAKRRFEVRLRELSGRNRGVSFARYISDINIYVRGWAGYFGLADVWRDWRRWTEWLRRRLRQVLLKQWKTRARRYRNLVRLGLTRPQARSIASSGKSLWRLSRSVPMNMALNARWFKAQGLLHLDDLWWTLAPLR